jgi:hypothetical protein
MSRKNPDSPNADSPNLDQPRPLANSYWVLPGRLLGGEHPGACSEAEVPKRIQRLLDGGIDYFVDLTELGEMPEYRHLLPGRADYLRSAIIDTGLPADVAQTRALVSVLRSALARKRSIYVHCRAGIGRTGLLIGCFLAEEDRDGEAALERLNRLWRQSARSKTWPKVPQTAEQADYVRCWPDLRNIRAG